MKKTAGYHRQYCWGVIRAWKSFNSLNSKVSIVTVHACLSMKKVIVPKKKLFQALEETNLHDLLMSF